MGLLAADDLLIKYNYWKIKLLKIPCTFSLFSKFRLGWDKVKFSPVRSPSARSQKADSVGSDGTCKEACIISGWIVSYLPEAQATEKRQGFSC